MPEPVTADEVVRYLASRDRGRANAVLDTLRAMTPREEQLVREAAVMGFARGRLQCVCTDCRARVPSDTDVLLEVVDACLALPDMYPAMARLREAGDG